MWNRELRDQLRAVDRRRDVLVATLPGLRVPTGRSTWQGMSLAQATECRNEFGRHLLIERPLEQIWPDLGERAQAWRTVPGGDSAMCPGATSFQQSFPQQVVVLDLETCGFAGTPIFLIGIIQSGKGPCPDPPVPSPSTSEHTPAPPVPSPPSSEHAQDPTVPSPPSSEHAQDPTVPSPPSSEHAPDPTVPSPPSSGERVRVRGTSHLGIAPTSGLVLRQIWARHYGEEAAALASFRQIVSHARCLVSFNGKSFDWPQVRDRGLIHRVTFDATEQRLCHWDILPSARRRWKAHLPNCRLQTLESLVCGRRRWDDLPGHRVPQVYHDYVRTGDDAEIEGILRHNQWDLLTLLELAIRLAPVTH